LARKTSSSSRGKAAAIPATTGNAGKVDRQATTRGKSVPGPSENPATNILLADIAVRGAAYIARRALERKILGRRYSPETARDIVKNRSIGDTLMRAGVARLATGSVPGALAVGGTFLAKLWLDRAKSRRKARLEGDRQLLETAKDT